jgi:hypothetical protein
VSLYPKIKHILIMFRSLQINKQSALARTTMLARLPNRQPPLPLSHTKKTRKHNFSRQTASLMHPWHGVQTAFGNLCTSNSNHAGKAAAQRNEQKYSSIQTCQPGVHWIGSCLLPTNRLQELSYCECQIGNRQIST